MSFRAIAAVAIGGVLGAFGRWGFEAITADAWFAPGLLLANLVGSLVLGFAASALRTAVHTESERTGLLGLTTGFCGALTSYSGLAVRAAELASSGHFGRSVVVLLCNIGVGLLLIALGVKAHRRLVAREQRTLTRGP